MESPYYECMKGVKVTSLGLKAFGIGAQEGCNYTLHEDDDSRLLILS